jgi:putative alpha-1,2-mannosidase
MTPFQYIFAGRPDMASDRVRRLLNTDYSTNVDGLPGTDTIYHFDPSTLVIILYSPFIMSLGNDDSGAMGSFVNWAMMGLVSLKIVFRKHSGNTM